MRHLLACRLHQTRQDVVQLMLAVNLHAAHDLAGLLLLEVTFMWH